MKYATDQRATDKKSGNFDRIVDQKRHYSLTCELLHYVNLMS